MGGDSGGASTQDGDPATALGFDVHLQIAPKVNGAP